MRNALLIAVVATLLFALFCVAASAERAYFGSAHLGSLPAFALASCALLAAFVVAGAAAAGEQPPIARTLRSIALVVVGFPLAWILGVNAGRVTAGAFGLPV